MKIRTFLLNLLGAAAVLSAGVSCSGGDPVTLSEDERTYTLDNGIVRVMVAKESGDLLSLRYEGRELLATVLDENGNLDLEKDPPGANPNGLNRGMTDHQYGFWSHDAMGPRGTAPAVATVTIDPASNGGRRAEVSVKGISGGRKMGTGPGASQEGQFVSDIEIRYTLEQGASGVYTYCIFEHLPSYGQTQIGEARFCAKLAPQFDWLSVSDERNFHYPKDYNAGDKYVYTVNQTRNRAFGWSSTTDSVGFYIINPSMEYMSGGPTKVEFLGHRDTNSAAAGCVLNYWRSSHYGGAEVAVADGEHWTKVIGPFLIYVASGDAPEALYERARAQVAREQARWPYEWVAGVDYPKAAERATVTGRLVLEDPESPAEGFSNLWVGLAAPEYVSPRGEDAPQVKVNWQRDAKFYQFWAQGGADGSFTLEQVRPGKYMLYAFADGVLGELQVADVEIGSGAVDLGTLEWKPLRYGRQLWEVGVPNRNGSEFYMADRRVDPEIALKYAEMFPDDVTFTVGESDWTRDWFFIQVPHNENPEARALPFFGVRTPGRATPFRVVFDLPQAVSGQAVLRVAVGGTAVRSVGVSVNETPVGELQLGMGDGIVARHGSQGLWYERELRFDASLLRGGRNTLVLTVPEGPVNNGVMYDYLRLELVEE